jgi:CDP-paratose 2-epimerase
MADAGASYLRTHISWADFCSEGGEAWYDWLIPTLARRIDLLPRIDYKAPSRSRTGRSSGALHRPRDYADFVALVLSRHGGHFGYVELSSELDNPLEGDRREDHDSRLTCEMAGDAASWVRDRGWKVVLGGPTPFDWSWLDLMGERGLLALTSAVGCRGFRGTWDSELTTWGGWEAMIAHVRDLLSRHNCAAEIWTTETGYSTWKHDEAVQLARSLSGGSRSTSRPLLLEWLAGHSEKCFPFTRGAIPTRGIIISELRTTVDARSCSGGFYGKAGLARFARPGDGRARHWPTMCGPRSSSAARALSVQTSRTHCCATARM